METKKEVMLFADYHFHIGKMHLNTGMPCQDYAFSGQEDDMAFAVISDGCSSGGHTDNGARIITLSTVKAIKDYWAKNGNFTQGNVFQEIVLRQGIICDGVQAVLGLSPTDMLATCVYACISSQGSFIHLLGDGVVALKYSSGKIVLRKFEWQKNTPFYPAYSRNGLMKDFIKTHGGELEKACLTEDMVIMETGKDVVENTITYTLKQGIEGVVIPISQDDLFEIEYIALFSDGATQIERTEWKKGILELLNFKSVAGKFAKRRMIRFLKDSVREDKNPMDDISYAVIRIEKDNNQN